MRDAYSGRVYRLGVAGAGWIGAAEDIVDPDEMDDPDVSDDEDEVSLSASSASEGDGRGTGSVSRERLMWTGMFGIEGWGCGWA